MGAHKTKKICLSKENFPVCKPGFRETETPEKCADEIANLAKLVLSSSPKTTVALSSIVTRIDDKVLAAN